MVAGLLSFGFKWLSQTEPRVADALRALAAHELQQRQGHQPRGSDFQTRLDHERVLPKLQGFPRPPLASVARHGEAPVSRPAEADRLASAVQRAALGLSHCIPRGGTCLA